MVNLGLPSSQILGLFSLNPLENQWGIFESTGLAESEWQIFRDLFAHIDNAVEQICLLLGLRDPLVSSPRRYYTPKVTILVELYPSPHELHAILQGTMAMGKVVVWFGEIQHLQQWAHLLSDVYGATYDEVTQETLADITRALDLLLPYALPKSDR